MSINIYVLILIRTYILQILCQIFSIYLNAPPSGQNLVVFQMFYLTIYLTFNITIFSMKMTNFYFSDPPNE